MVRARRQFIADSHVNSLGYRVRRLIEGDIPPPRDARQIRARLGKKRFPVARVIRIPFRKLAFHLEGLGMGRIESNNFELTHSIKIAFMNLQIIDHGLLIIRERGMRHYSRSQVSTRAVKIMNVSKVQLKLHSVGRLAGLEVDIFHQVGAGDNAVSRKLKSCQAVLKALANRNRDGDRVLEWVVLN